MAPPPPCCNEAVSWSVMAKVDRDLVQSLLFISRLLRNTILFFFSFFLLLFALSRCRGVELPSASEVSVGGLYIISSRCLPHEDFRRHPWISFIRRTGVRESKALLMPRSPPLLTLLWLARARVEASFRLGESLF